MLVSVMWRKYGKNMDEKKSKCDTSDKSQLTYFQFRYIPPVFSKELTLVVSIRKYHSLGNVYNLYL